MSTFVSRRHAFLWRVGVFYPIGGTYWVGVVSFFQFFFVSCSTCICVEGEEGW